MLKSITNLLLNLDNSCGLCPLEPLKLEQSMIQIPHYLLFEKVFIVELNALTLPDTISI